jgi:hypothetical protein
MPNSSRSRRRWFQFGSPTLILFVAVLACWLAYHVEWVRQRHEFLAHHDTLRRQLEWNEEVPTKDHLAKGLKAPAIFTLTGEPSHQAVTVVVVVDDYVESPPIMEFDEWKRAESLFPEAEVFGAFISRRDVDAPPPPSMSAR